jgi:hypothetical protein
MLPKSDSGYFQIHLTAGEKEDDYPALTDVDYFLHDFNLLYELSHIVVDPKYSDYKFTRFFPYRNRRRIAAPDQLAVERLSYESPLELVTLVMALPSVAATIWVVVQTMEKIADRKIKREILELTRDKLRRELQAPNGMELAAPQGLDESYREQIRIRGAEYHYETIEKHLQQNPIRISRIDVTYVRELKIKSGKKN